MLRCIIIEDQPPAQRVLQKYISDMGTLELAETFSDAVQAVTYLKAHPVDLIFLDIHLPKLSGIDFLKAIEPKPHVILTTAFSEYALESYEYHVVDYLLKPFSFERFVKAVSKVPHARYDGDHRFQTSDTNGNNGETVDVLFIKSGYEHLKIQVSDIQYIQSEADYTEIFTPERKYLTSQSLKYWLGHLGEHRFIQVHKSYVIQKAKVMKVSGNRIFFDPDTQIPIGRAYKEDFMKHVLNEN